METPASKTKRVLRTIAALLLVAAVLALLSKCYYVRQAVGQIDILLYSRSVEEVLESEDLTPAQKERLRLILDIKSFGEHHVGLAPTDNYTTFYQVPGRHVSYIVLACPKDSLQPHTWSFPIVGDLPYKGFFDLEDARSEAKDLAEQDFDVLVRPVAAYSTLGWFSDPVLSTMLDYSADELASLILHEMTHGTLYVEGKADFNEALASFVGSTGTLQYLRMRFGIDSDEYERAVKRMADRETFASFMERLREKLVALYARPILRGQKISEREKVFLRAKADFRKLKRTLNTDLYDSFEYAEVNNAYVEAHRIYTNDKPFRDLYREMEGRWPDFWESLRRSAGGGEVTLETPAKK